MFTKELNLKIGDILIEKGVITKSQLETALKEQSKQGADNKKLGNFLIDIGYVTEVDIANALGMQFNLPVMRLEGLRIKPEVLDTISETMVKKFNIMPIFKVGDELTLAISDPTDILLIDMVTSATKCKIIPVISPYSDISKAINRHYYMKVETESGDTLLSITPTTISRTEIEELKMSGTDLPIIKIVDRILIEAVEDNASDIHIEPREAGLSVRFRVDGMLRDIATYPIKTHSGIVSRLKILSALDIAEKQKPQDGRIKIKIDDKEIDIRVSILPALYGEKIVLRLLNRANVKVSLEELNFSKNNFKTFLSLIKEPYGIILVTGPTGSGKTTTLYAALYEVNSVEKNIITVEDPIEYQLPVINQMQVNPKKDLTFANALRAILRQDPDIIMIGEIRDPETASIAAESALTGHLVFSTLHTNDAPSSITRLTDMGVEPFLLAPSLLGVIAQRLVRRICPKCKEAYTPSKAELLTISLDIPSEGLKFYRGAGCDNCKHTGYSGRTGIHEILVLDEKIREMITQKATAGMIRAEAAKNGFRDMRFDGLKKVMSGDTTTEELLRVTKANK
ncbi:MAG: Flp pilus assembly complex ATPase component TadA [Nitrospirae bacterium]|nr:Flp pilus assembly complex ATPase component TadA [Nitrospirota bacterium]